MRHLPTYSLNIVSRFIRAGFLVSSLAILLAACGGGGGGGTAGTGSNGGTGTGGTGGTGNSGGTSTSNSLATFADPAGTNGHRPQLMVDANGVQHLVYFGFSGMTVNGSTVYPVRYGECASNCGAASSWSFVTVANAGSFGGEARLGLDTSGHPRVMYQYVPALSSTVSSWHYAECNANCATSASNWTDALVFDLKGNSSYTPGFHNFAVDAGGGMHLIYAIYENGNNHTNYLECSSSCSNASNWKSLLLNATDQDIASIAVTSTGGVRALFTSTSTKYLRYRECNTNCAASIANWGTADTPIYFANGTHSRIVIGPKGTLHIAWFQGNTSDPKSLPTINLMLYSYCNGTCTNDLNWVGSTVDLPVDDGKDGFDLAVDASGTPAIAYKMASGGLGLNVCTANCTNPNTSVWKNSVNLETSDSVGAEILPPPSSCTSPDTPLTSYWFPGYEPSIALVGTSAVAIAHRTTSTEACKNPTTLGITTHDGPSLIRMRLVQ